MSFRVDIEEKKQLNSDFTAIVPANSIEIQFSGKVLNMTLIDAPNLRYIELTIEIRGRLALARAISEEISAEQERGEILVLLLNHKLEDKGNPGALKEYGGRKRGSGVWFLRKSEFPVTVMEKLTRLALEYVQEDLINKPEIGRVARKISAPKDKSYRMASSNSDLGKMD